MKQQRFRSLCYSLLLESNVPKSQQNTLYKFCANPHIYFQFFCDLSDVQNLLENRCFGDTFLGPHDNPSHTCQGSTSMATDTSTAWPSSHSSKDLVVSTAAPLAASTLAAAAAAAVPPEPWEFRRKANCKGACIAWPCSKKTSRRASGLTVWYPTQRCLFSTSGKKQAGELN